jgi:hypothetical protein
MAPVGFARLASAGPRLLLRRLASGDTVASARELQRLRR